jgi:hypothetical protein
MRSGSLQQAFAGLAVVLAIAATLLGGLILAISDMARSGRSLGESLPPATILRIPTLPPLTEMLEETVEQTEVTDTVIPTRTAEIRATHTVSTTPTVAPTATASATPSPSISPEPEPEPTATPRRSSSAPRPTAAPTLTRTPVASVTQSETDGICTNPDSVITAPRVGAVLNGQVEFYGTARIPNFAFYKLEIRRQGQSTAADYVTFHTGTITVTNGLLATFDTGAWPDGEYWIRLVVVDTTGNYPERCAILYRID